MDAATSGAFDGRFQLGDLLGVGGSAAVYEAVDLGRVGPDGNPVPVAVKVLHHHLAERPEFRDAFLREARRLAGVHDPNVVAVHGCGLAGLEGEEVAWIALDRLDGPTLAEWVEASGPLPVAEAVAVGRGLLAGLAAVHAAGLVHRDVNPGNVILAGTPGRGGLDASMVRLVDFGLAAAPGASTRGSDPLLAADAGSATGVVGNAAYLSPEQAAGAPVTAAGDQYQAGAVLYFLLTGQPPFPRPSVDAVLRAHLTAPPPVPSALAPAARSMDQVVAKALAKQPERRYADAEAFAAALAVASGPAPSATRVLNAAVPGSGRTTVTAPRELPAAEPEPEQLFAEPSVLFRVLGGLLVALFVGSMVLALAAGTSTPATSASPSPSASATPSPSPSPSASPSALVEVGVPTLVGDLDAARSRLDAVGLRLGKVRVVDAPQASGRVLKQSPAAGELAVRGARVDLWLASGRNLVPAVAGLAAADAEAALTAAGFRPSGTPVDGTVVVAGSQPGEGARLPVGAGVALLLASAEPTPTAGPDPTASPSPSVSG